MENIRVESELKVESYYFFRKVDMSFDDAIVRITEELKKEEFGVVTEINVTDIFKKRIDVAFRRYTILGACSPGFALKGIRIEPHIGTMMPCNIVVQELSKDCVEVSVVDPVASMMAVRNKELEEILLEVQARMKRVLANI